MTAQVNGEVHRLIMCQADFHKVDLSLPKRKKDGLREENGAVGMKACRVWQKSY